jgi:hypothetical protein
MNPVHSSRKTRCRLERILMWLCLILKTLILLLTLLDLMQRAI